MPKEPRSSSQNELSPNSSSKRDKQARRTRSTSSRSTPTQKRAEQRFDYEFESAGEIRTVMRLEGRFGQRVDGWLDEGMPIEAMGNPTKMEAFRTHKGTPIPWDIDDRNNRSHRRNTSSILCRRRERPNGKTKVPNSVRGVISSPGHSLEPSIQRAMEERMGDSFGDVRVHAGPKAAEACDDINARAFTVGNHVAFNHGEYDPASAEGQHIIAHELAHVRQQTGGAVSMLPQDGLEIDPDPELEAEAEEVADRVIAGGTLGIQRARELNIHIQRMESGDPGPSTSHSEITPEIDQNHGETPKIDEAGEVCKKIVEEIFTAVKTQLSASSGSQPTSEPVQGHSSPQQPASHRSLANPSVAHSGILQILMPEPRNYPSDVNPERSGTRSFWSDVEKIWSNKNISNWTNFLTFSLGYDIGIGIASHYEDSWGDAAVWGGLGGCLAVIIDNVTKGAVTKVADTIITAFEAAGKKATYSDSNSNTATISFLAQSPLQTVLSVGVGNVAGSVFAANYWDETNRGYGFGAFITGAASAILLLLMRLYFTKPRSGDCLPRFHRPQAGIQSQTPTPSLDPAPTRSHSAPPMQRQQDRNEYEQDIRQYLNLSMPPREI